MKMGISFYMERKKKLQASHFVEHSVFPLRKQGYILHS